MGCILCKNECCRCCTSGSRVRVIKSSKVAPGYEGIKVDIVNKTEQEHPKTYPEDKTDVRESNNTVVSEEEKREVEDTSVNGRPHEKQQSLGKNEAQEKHCRTSNASHVPSPHRLIQSASTTDSGLGVKSCLNRTSYSGHEAADGSLSSFSSSFGSSILDDIGFSSDGEWSPIATPPLVGGPQHLPIRTYKGKVIIELKDSDILPKLDSLKFITEYSDLELVKQVEKEFQNKFPNLSVVGKAAKIHDIAECRPSSREVMEDLEKERIISDITLKSPTSQNNIITTSLQTGKQTKRPSKLSRLDYGKEKQVIESKKSKLSSELRKMAQRKAKKAKLYRKLREKQLLKQVSTSFMYQNNIVNFTVAINVHVTLLFFFSNQEHWWYSRQRIL